MMSDPPDRVTKARAAYHVIQDAMCAALAGIDGGSFSVDRWARSGGGGGESRVLEGDGSIERAAALHSDVWGETPDRLSDTMAVGSTNFRATGVSVIVHPRNPHAPTLHANLRYFELDDGRSWFGGGADLTPYYLYEEDATHFHRILREVCERHPIADYPHWKRSCDEYFRLPHRGEARGIGGIFFDHITDPTMHEYQVDLGSALIDAYVPILERRSDTPFGADQEEWHLIRRGRYAEFNLVWDRGTRFGLETAGRTESILSSLPPRARWVYRHAPPADTPEAELLEFLSGEPREW